VTKWFVKLSLMVVLTLFPYTAHASAIPCITETVAALLAGPPCSIGQLQLSFTGFLSLGTNVPALTTSQITFTPGGTVHNPSFTLSGDFYAVDPPGIYETHLFFSLYYTASVSGPGGP
jgi:hypothetical protein